MKTELIEKDDMLKVLQYLAEVKIGKYEAKWSKSSEDSIERLQRDFDSVDELFKYFTKR